MIPRIGNDNITFGYRHRLKDLYKKGLLPLKYGFYGGELTKQNVSLEHLLPHSKGGKTELYNLVLATKENNHRRADLPIKGFISIEDIRKYLGQFLGVLTPDFDGEKYIKSILRTLKNMGVEI